MVAYIVRFHVLPMNDIPPFAGYALQLVPILVVWGFAFRAFDLYRPNRLGSHVSEWLDVAKASTLGVLVLVAIMTFAFRGYDYSRLVIVLFWAESERRIECDLYYIERWSLAFDLRILIQTLWYGIRNRNAY